MGDAVSRSMLRHAKRGLAPRRTESTKAALFLIAAAFLVVLPFVSAEVGGGPADAAATGAPVVAETKTQASAHIHVPVGKKENEQPRKSASGGTKLDAKKEDELDFALLGGVAAAVLIGAAGGVYLLCAGGSGKKKRRFKGDAIYLLGLCDAGKTSMLFLLRDGMQGGKLHETQTSQAPNEDTFVPSGAEGGALRVLDFPGHGRLRPQLFDIVEDCRAVIFLVDATTFSTNGAHRDAWTRRARARTPRSRLTLPPLCPDCSASDCGVPARSHDVDGVAQGALRPSTHAHADAAWPPPCLTQNDLCQTTYPLMLSPSCSTPSACLSCATRPTRSRTSSLASRSGPAHPSPSDDPFWQQRGDAPGGI